MAKEFYLGQSLAAGNEESTLLQDPYEESEEEEALSLCDLPLHSNSISAQWGDDDNISKEDGRNSRSNNNSKENDNDDDDFFGFFSEEFTTSTTHSTTTTADNIIFCGKLIPFKDPPQKGNNPQSNIQKGTLLPWRSNSRPTSKAVTCSDGSFNKGQGAKGAKSTNFTYEYSSIGKVSLMRSTTKSRWFLFMFGMSRLSNTEMELRDIRSRQSRSRSRRTMFAAAPENVEEMKIERSRNCKGLWRVLRSISVGLGCRSSKLANDVVKAAFV